MLQRSLAMVTLLLVIGISVALALRPGPGAEPESEGQAAIGGSFTLTDQTAHPRSEADLKGHWSIVYFGFTHCPDLCPLGLGTITEALKELGAAGNTVQPFFVTLDPERDDAAALKSYLAAFSPRWTGLTGSAAQVKQAADAYKVYYAREDTPDSALGYTINHSGFIYLMDESGRYRTHFRHDDAAETIAAGIRQALSSQH